jgi:Uma2 family endonuclease
MRKMKVMDQVEEVIKAPLSSDELAVRYRNLCDDPCFANVPGKIEIDVWGRVLMSPPGTYHALVQGRLCQRLAVLGGETLGEAAIATAMGLFVTDAAWASTEFIRLHRGESPFMIAPELCVEIASPSNSAKEIEEKVAAYLGAGAQEVWILYLQSKRCEFYGPQGMLQRSRFPVDLSDLFR